MKYLTIVLASAMAIASLSGCNAFKKQQSTAPAASTATVKQDAKRATDIRPIDRVLYGEWMAMDVNGAPVKGESRPYLVFDTVATNPYLAKFYGYDGCNTINGTVALTAGGSMKKASEYLTTMMYCPDAEYEIAVSMLLDNISSYKIEKVGDGALMYLTGSDKKQTMVLRRSDLGWLNGAWQVRRIGDKVLDDTANAPQIVIDLPEHRVHGNTGCNVLNGTVESDPDQQHSVRFVNLGTTRMMCPNIETEQLFVNALSTVTTAHRAENDNAADLRDASGKLVMELVRIDLKAMRDE